MSIINTNCGDIEGVELDDVISYRGIRYATAGLFEYPELVEKWDGVYDATAYKNCCYQERAFYDEADNPSKAFYYKEFREGLDLTYSDDCLFLNIWTPKNVTNMSVLPVIIYIHGGSFTGGAGHEKHFDGPKWCEHNVIAVTINYRLGPWGFICLPELKDEAGYTGNYAMFDMIAAITWVKNNIKEFGGNPTNITVMGQSAGAMSVQQLVLSPLTKGLFQRAVMSSGAGVNSILNVHKEPDKYYWFWEKVKNEAGCDTIMSLRKVDPKVLFDCYLKVKNEDKPGMVCFPCIDGRFMTKSSAEVVKNKELKNIPYMVGSNSHDMLPAFLHAFAKKWCLQVGNGKTYCYFFERELPGDNNGAWHSSDLWYWFGTLKNCWRPFEETDMSLSNRMISYLCNFARTGNPNGIGLPNWEPTTKYNKKVMMFGDHELKLGRPSMRRLIKNMLTKKAAGE